jgi:hypothetical protein
MGGSVWSCTDSGQLVQVILARSRGVRILPTPSLKPSPIEKKTNQKNIRFSHRFIFLGIVALGFLLWSPVPYRRYFAVTQQPVFPYSDVVNPEFAHPKYSQIIPIVADALVAVFAPFIAIFLVNIFGIGTFAEPGVKTVKDQRRGTCFGRRGSFWNASNGYIGVIYAVMTGMRAPDYYQDCDTRSTSAFLDGVRSAAGQQQRQRRRIPPDLL